MSVRQELQDLEGLRDVLTEGEYQAKRAQILGLAGAGYSSPRQEGFYTGGAAAFPTDTYGGNTYGRLEGSRSPASPEQNRTIVNDGAIRTQYMNVLSEEPPLASSTLSPGQSERRALTGSWPTRAGVLDDDWLNVTLNTLKRKLEQRYGSMRIAFLALDDQKVGLIETRFLSRKLDDFNLGVTEEQLLYIAEHLDANKDGYVTYLDFMNVIKHF
eukprot:NODE_1605_length_827_cov_286.266067_g1245_i0.p1 GENE.NODE_1605_length_827_cov_286.266067_g1245_i0~~NODE_1605_length_827_cov_286.266067_g1245_i0.p1  ORF type:complete len:214 (-),score=29.90 NODE_1605_length_827_cov_286.266067_g1245_i0:129-770(-)